MLSEAQREELLALMGHVDAIGGPSFIAKFHWRGLYQALVQRGLVTWKPHPTMGPDYRSVDITPVCRAALKGE